MITKERVLRQLDQTWVVIDQVFNVFTGGWADETFSSRTWRNRETQPFKILHPIINTIFFSKTHCEDAFISERRYDDLPPELRK